MPGSKLGYFNSVISDLGRPIVATITVYDAGTATPSTIYADAGGVTPLANPFSTDAIGRFQFYAATGKYDVQVSGAGITTYKIQNVSLSDISLISELMDVTTYFCVTPEQYGAVGDGATDDWASFNAMFAALAISTAPRKKVILNPAVYYSIQSRLNATNVFEIDVDNLIMEGPGMGVKTIMYEGALTATNFMFFKNQPGYNDLHDLQIVCGPGDDSNTRDLSKITNIICWDDTKYTSLARVELVGCTGKCVTGYNWMSENRHCLFKWFGVAGLDEVSTTAYVVNCYANGGTILAGSRGFIIDTAYGFYGGNAVDHADIGYYCDMPGGGIVALQGNGAEGCNQYLKSTGGVIYLDGFAGNNTGLTGLPDAWIEVLNCSGRITGFSNTYDNTYLLQTTNSPDLIIDGNIPKEDILVTDAAADHFFDPIRHARDYSGDNFRTVAAADFDDLVNITLRNYNGCQDATAIIPDGTVTYTATLSLFNMGGYGKFTFCRQNAWGTTAFTFNQSVGNGFEIENIHIPLYFNGLNDTAHISFKFIQSGTGVLFKLTNCQLVTFYGVILDAVTGSGDVFEMDDFSTLVLDKTVMDLMSPLFSGLCNKPERIKFTGYSDKPTGGVFDTGCKIYFTAPTAGGYEGCVCTAGGAPGTWKYFGAVQA